MPRTQRLASKDHYGGPRRYERHAIPARSRDRARRRPGVSSRVCFGSSSVESANAASAPNSAPTQSDGVCSSSSMISSGPDAIPTTTAPLSISKLARAFHTVVGRAAGSSTTPASAGSSASADSSTATQAPATSTATKTIDKHENISPSCVTPTTPPSFATSKSARTFHAVVGRTADSSATPISSDPPHAVSWNLSTGGGGYAQTDWDFLAWDLGVNTNSSKPHSANNEPPDAVPTTFRTTVVANRTANSASHSSIQNSCRRRLGTMVSGLRTMTSPWPHKRTSGIPSIINDLTNAGSAAVLGLNSSAAASGILTPSVTTPSTPTSTATSIKTSTLSPTSTTSAITQHEAPSVSATVPQIVVHNDHGKPFQCSGRYPLQGCENVSMTISVATLNDGDGSALSSSTTVQSSASGSVDSPSAGDTCSHVGSQGGSQASSLVANSGSSAVTAIVKVSIRADKSKLSIDEHDAATNVNECNLVVVSTESSTVTASFLLKTFDLKINPSHDKIESKFDLFRGWSKTRYIPGDIVSTSLPRSRKQVFKLKRAPAQTTISSILQKAPATMGEAYDDGRRHKSLEVKSLAMEQKLWAWIRTNLQKEICNARKLDVSDEWLTGFGYRHGLRYRKYHDEVASADTTAVYQCRPLLRYGIGPIHLHERRPLREDEEDKNHNRATAYVDGCNALPPLLFVRATQPYCFKKRTASWLSFQHKAYQKASMTVRFTCFREHGRGLQRYAADAGGARSSRSGLLSDGAHDGIVLACPITEHGHVSPMRTSPTRICPPKRGSGRPPAASRRTSAAWSSAPATSAAPARTTRTTLHEAQDSGEAHRRFKVLTSRKQKPLNPVDLRPRLVIERLQSLERHICLRVPAAEYLADLVVLFAGIEDVVKLLFVVVMLQAPQSKIQ
ncbi:hypothetical protein ON010_g7784 [Phytophthora cinnamomi]|nr:hypothetical protein ON010_g7784 [Phytophthora cinnamomi]